MVRYSDTDDLKFDMDCLDYVKNLLNQLHKYNKAYDVFDDFEMFNPRAWPFAAGTSRAGTSSQQKTMNSYGEKSISSLGAWLSASDAVHAADVCDSSTNSQVVSQQYLKRFPRKAKVELTQLKEEFVAFKTIEYEAVKRLSNAGEVLKLVVRQGRLYPTLKILAEAGLSMLVSTVENERLHSQFKLIRPPQRSQLRLKIVRDSLYVRSVFKWSESGDKRTLQDVQVWQTYMEKLIELLQKKKRSRIEH